MKYTHVVVLASGNKETYTFLNKAESNKALENGKKINDTFGTIKSIEVSKNGKDTVTLNPKTDDIEKYLKTKYKSKKKDIER